MGLYRTVETKIWEDTWFSELYCEGKVLFLWAMTNDRQTACGAFEVSLRQIAFDTGLCKEGLAKALEEVEPKVMWWPEHNVLWVRNFYRYQNRNAHAESFRQGALKAKGWVGLAAPVVGVQTSER